MGDMELKSFGHALRYFRGKTINKATGKPLSQEKLAMLLTDALTDTFGSIFSRNVISNWEKNKVSPHAQRDRQLLTSIIQVLTYHRGVTSLDEANQLLQAGNYQALTLDEIEQVNPSWNSASNDKSKEESLKVSSPSQSVPHVGPIEIRITEPIEMVYRRAQPRLGSAPPVPSLFIGRDDDMANLKKNLGLFGGTSLSLQVLTAIKGWPGVGKTTIASALAHDSEVQQAFPDGVLWVSLGKHPNILSEMSTWGRALGTDELLHAKTVEEAKSLLTALLRSRKMLLIIDDVWTSEDALPFEVGGPDCATLVTTRRDDIAIALAPSAVNIYRLKVLSDEDALKLLSELAPKVVDQHPGESIILVKELEGLPLAIQVAGRLLSVEINRGFDVTELLEELRAGARLLEATPPADRLELANETTPTIASLLQKSIDLLDETSRDCYAYLGVFAPKPATFDVDALSSVWQTNNPKPFIDILVDRGLLEYVPELRRYQMHALLVMLAKSLLTDDEA